MTPTLNQIADRGAATAANWQATTSADPNVEHLLASYKRIRRIGLLSPTSGNLGNAAMQSAMIANIRKRIAGVEIVGLSLNPDDTSRRHGIQAFPLAGISRPYYSVFSSGTSKPQHQLGVRLSGIKRWLKQIPVLGRFLKVIRNCSKELAHTRAAAHVVSKLDCIIVPGGGALDEFWGGPWGHPWTLFKWSLLSRVYGVGFLFVSIGKSSLERPLSRFFVRIALQLAEYRSYRDDDSRITGEALIDTHNDPVYPDLAFSYPCSALQSSRRNRLEEDRLVIGVSPIAYCDPRVWPHKDRRRYIAYVSQLAEMVKWLIKEGYRVLFFITDAPDGATVEDVQAMVSGDFMGAHAIQVLPGSAEQTPDSLLKGLSRADLVIASRLHGVILSHLNATPVLALSFDPKVDAHMAAVKQKDYCLTIDDIQLEALVGRFKALKVARQRERVHLRSVALRFRDLLDEQYDRILTASRPSSITPDHHNKVDAFPVGKP